MRSLLPTAVFLALAAAALLGGCAGTYVAVDGGASRSRDR
jgi:hypothetical protein